VINENTLLVKSFSYDGLAPAATFLAGKSGQPVRDNSIIIPYPFDGKSYNYEDDAPILAEFNNEEIMLTLPENLKSSEIKWLSVWCRVFHVNFGDVSFPSN